MYKAILIDDEPLGRELIKSYLKPYTDVQVVAECADGFTGFKAIQEHTPHLVFLDVQMPRVNGFELLELLDNPPAVIFTTAFDEYALKAFEAHAIDYLLKPISRERLDKAMQKWLLQASATNNQSLQELAQQKVYEGYQQRIVVKDNGLIRIIPAQDIHYIEANDDYIKIVTKEGSYLKKNALNHIEQMLNPEQFVRVHRSYLIPVSQLVRIEPYEKESHIALLQCGAKITVSKTGMAKLKHLLGW
jgi:two-component system LytT family response regulator